MDRSDFCLKNKNRIYLDHNATTPPAQSVMEMMHHWALEWGNPSSIHQTSRGPKQILRSGRTSIASALGCHPLELIFTSGGSESNNQIIQGVFFNQQKIPQDKKRNKYLYSAVEHPSVRKTMQSLRELGAEVEEIGILPCGNFDWQDFESKLSDEVALVSVMFANNETGNIFPVKELAERVHQKGALFHCDAVQALGKAPIDFHDWGVDFATLSAHKFYGLKGSGLTFCRSGIELPALIIGGGQERGRRAGTENILSVASFAHMVEHLEDIDEQIEYLFRLRNHLQSLILNRISGVTVTGGTAPRLPNTLSVVIDGVDGETLLMNLDMRGVSVSTGAACSSGSPEPSPVLLAMGLSVDQAQSSLRLSLGWGNTLNEIETFVDILESVVERVRSLNSAEGGDDHVHP